MLPLFSPLVRANLSEKLNLINFNNTLSLRWSSNPKSQIKKSKIREQSPDQNGVKRIKTDLKLNAA
jgi:hypothetical protein